MYSGTFTHFIKPVLPVPQIEKVFGLLGYQLSSRHEQLRLQPSRLSPGSLGDLLRLSCAFFLARCECRLLLTALGRRAGESQWELSMVRERLRGNSLQVRPPRPPCPPRCLRQRRAETNDLRCSQVALDNTKKKLDVGQPLFEGEEEVDLYTDEQLNGEQRPRKDESARSNRASQSGAPPPPAPSALSNGAVSSSPASASVPAREDVHVSTLNCQLIKTAPPEQDVPHPVVKEGKLPCEESPFGQDDSPPPRSQQAERAALGRTVAGADVCSCVQSPDVSLKLCGDCNALHSVSCAVLQDCAAQSHYAASPDLTDQTIEELTAVFSQGGSRRGASPPLVRGGAAASPLAGCDDSSQPAKPIPNHHRCCELAQLDPQLLCLTCGVFHSGSCREKNFCQKNHDVKQLGLCSCGSTCPRTPMVLCRYCGQEYCTLCWYRNPVKCSCGQTFDQSPV